MLGLLDLSVEAPVNSSWGDREIVGDDTIQSIWIDSEPTQTVLLRGDLGVFPDFMLAFRFSPQITADLICHRSS
ncbi:MAG: hypothetical protein OXQ89_24685 [Rhodospirillaceae bacterium]|nr:hypothetical protein [Rhodospirillaceae bacterium]MDE0000945.1 hypothetical protein [Rhodospirillaceae bacterium]